MSSDVPFEDAVSLLMAAAVVDPSLVQLPNTPFNEPAGDPPSLWLSVDCVGTSLDPIEMGGGGWQEEGTFYVWVMAPANTGSAPARQIAKAVANAFRNLGPRNVNYRGASIGQGVERQTTGLWWVLPISVDWVYQDTTSG